MSDQILTSFEVTNPGGDGGKQLPITDVVGTAFRDALSIPDEQLSKPLQIHAFANNRVAGIEYMVRVHNILRAGGGGSGLKIVLTGDSTTTEAEVAQEARREYALPVIARRRGFGITLAVNRGQSGKNCAEWVSTYLAGDIAEAPDLIIVGWGGNNDAGSGRTPAQYLASLESGLAALRSYRGVTAMSIIVMSACSTYDIPNGRYSAYYEQTIQGVKDLCRQYLCCFVDRYSTCIDSQNGAGIWKDNPYGDGRGIHDLTTASLVLTNVLADVIWPDAIGKIYGNANFENISNTDGPVTPQTSIDNYGVGFSLRRANGGSPAWPFDGAVETTRHIDGQADQVNYSYILGDGEVRAHRRYVAAPSPGWGPFSLVGTGAPANVAPRAAFALDPTEKMSTVLTNGRQVTGRGYIAVSTPGAQASGTDFAVIAAGHRPVSGTWPVTLVAWDGALWKPFGAIIAATGQLVSIEAVSLTVLRIYFGGSSWFND